MFFYQTLNLKINKRYDFVVKKRRKKIKKQKSNPYLLPIGIVIILAIGVYALKGGGGDDSAQVTDTSSGSPPPLSALPVSLPDYAKQTKDIEASYIIATQISDVLEKIPCYCNCGESSGHKSLKHCFINDAGTFDRHGSFCTLCRDEAYEVYTWYTDGVPLKEIRARIDDKYGKGFGKGTDTPPV